MNKIAYIVIPIILCILFIAFIVTITLLVSK